MSNVQIDLDHALKALKLPYLRANWDRCIDQAARNDLSHADFLREIIGDEIAAREENKLRKLLATAGFPFHKTLDDFDFRLRPELQRKVFETYAEDSFVKQGKSLVLVGPPGLGKTHLAVAIGIRMVHRRYKVKCITVQEFLNLYLACESPKQWKRLVRPYRSCDLLILDEFGYLAPDSRIAPLLYELISDRYEKSATIVTSNKSLKEWGKVLHDVSLASAIVDRVMHHGEVYYLTGESYRLRGKRSNTSEQPALKGAPAL